MLVIFLIQLDYFTGKETDTQKDELMLSVSSSTKNQIQVYVNPKSTFFTIYKAYWSYWSLALTTPWHWEISRMDIIQVPYRTVSIKWDIICYMSSIVSSMAWTLKCSQCHQQGQGLTSLSHAPLVRPFVLCPSAFLVLIVTTGAGLPLSWM